PTFSETTIWVSLITSVQLAPQRSPAALELSQSTGARRGRDRSRSSPQPGSRSGLRSSACSSRYHQREARLLHEPHVVARLDFGIDSKLVEDRQCPWRYGRVALGTDGNNDVIDRPAAVGVVGLGEHYPAVGLSFGRQLPQEDIVAGWSDHSAQTHVFG